MSLICPTVLADNPHTFREQLERIVPFAKRIQIDLMDGIFAPTTSVELAKIWLPDGASCDLHLMFERPGDYLRQIITLKPNMVIVHAESQVDVPKFAADLSQHGIKCGLAVLPETSIESVGYILPHVHHLLIFGGKLGYFGGAADLSQLTKVSQAKQLHKWLELGWDGGANLENVKLLSDGGIDVINVGSAIQKAENPKLAYEQLEKTLA